MEEASIIKALAFFDLFGIPLTEAEVFSHAYAPAGEAVAFSQCRYTIGKLVEQGKLKRQEAFVTLPDRHPDMVIAYKQRQARSFEMIRDVQPWLARLAAWPSVRGVAICNSLSFLNAHDQSDIDIFLLVESGKLWTTRFAIVSMLHLLGKRPQEMDQAGKMCLSFFLDNESPELEGMALDNDVYLSYWAKLLIPVHEKEGSFSAFHGSNRTLLSPVSRELPKQRVSGSQSSGWIPSVFGAADSLLSKLQEPIKRWQYRRFPRDIRESLGRGKGVIVSDQMLKFHTQDRREEYRQKWVERYSGFLSELTPSPSLSKRGE